MHPVLLLENLGNLREVAAKTGIGTVDKGRRSWFLIEIFVV